MRALAAALLGAWLALGPHPARAERDTSAPGWGVKELMASLGTIREGSAHFVERKTQHVTTLVLQSSGTLRYQAPDRLDKQTLLPRPGLLRIDGEHLTIAVADAAPSQVSLQDAPELAALVAGVRATMAGDLATLDRFYTLSLTGTATDWQLMLEPKQSQARALVAFIRISGSRTALQRVQTQERDGDETDMIITSDPP
jgi:hypothetical protein